MPRRPAVLAMLLVLLGASAAPPPPYTGLRHSEQSLADMHWRAVLAAGLGIDPPLAAGQGSR